VAPITCVSISLSCNDLDLKFPPELFQTLEIHDCESLNFVFDKAGVPAGVLATFFQGGGGKARLLNPMLKTKLRADLPVDPLDLSAFVFPAVFAFCNREPPSEGGRAMSERGDRSCEKRLSVAQKAKRRTIGVPWGRLYFVLGLKFRLSR
jgi:hypothetical protein